MSWDGYIASNTEREAAAQLRTVLKAEGEMLATFYLTDVYDPDAYTKTKPGGARQEFMQRRADWVQRCVAAGFGSLDDWLSERLRQAGVR